MGDELKGTGICNMWGVPPTFEPEPETKTQTNQGKGDSSFTGNPTLNKPAAADLENEAEPLPESKRITQVYPNSENSIHKVYGQQASKPARKRATLNPIAVEWLAAHRDALRAAGWTPQELYQRHRFSRSVLFSGVWNKPDLVISINGQGVISFSWMNPTGQRITQTDRAAGRRLIKQ